MTSTAPPAVTLDAYGADAQEFINSCRKHVRMVAIERSGPEVETTTHQATMMVQYENRDRGLPLPAGRQRCWEDREMYELRTGLYIVMPGEDESRVTIDGVLLHETNVVATRLLRSRGFRVDGYIRGTAYVYRLTDDIGDGIDRYEDVTDEDIAFVHARLQ